MSAIAAYQIIEEIYESDKSLVYRGRGEQDARPVILKVLKSAYPTPEAIARYKLEYEITCLRAYGLLKYNNSLVMILDNFGVILKYIDEFQKVYAL